jgi:hypothetical protein
MPTCTAGGSSTSLHPSAPTSGLRTPARNLAATCQPTCCGAPQQDIAPACTYLQPSTRMHLATHTQQERLLPLQVSLHKVLPSTSSHPMPASASRAASQPACIAHPRPHLTAGEGKQAATLLWLAVHPVLATALLWPTVRPALATAYFGPLYALSWPQPTAACTNLHPPPVTHHCTAGVAVRGGAPQQNLAPACTCLHPSTRIHSDTSNKNACCNCRCRCTR